MAIRDLDRKISQEDVNRVRDIRNPPEYEPGFEGGSSSSGGDFDSLFDDGAFSELDSSGFGADSPQQGGQNNMFPSGDPFGGGSSFGGQSQFAGQNQFGNGFNLNGIGTGFNGMNQQQPVQAKPDMMDKVIDASGEAAVSFGKVMLEFFKSIKLRNADDFGYLSRNLILTGLGFAGVGLVIGILGTIYRSPIISFAGFPTQFIGAGMLTLGTGLSGLGFSAIKIANSTDEQRVSIQELPDVADSNEDDASEEYEDNIGSIMDDLFSGDEESLFGDTEEPEETSETNTELDEPEFAAPVHIDFNEELGKVAENQYLSRETLFNTFKPFLPCNTPTFADKRVIDPSESTFGTIEALALKALCNVAKCEYEDLKSKLEELTETYFSYELRLKRVRGLKNTEDIAREMEAYFRENSSDTSVNATVDIEGDYYRVVITKGESAVVTFGDIFKDKKICDFFLDTNNKLPMITGITELGEVIVNDAKIFDTMLIAGKPRSGKSWYVFSILMALAMFNTPEDVQFIVVDPKESNLFNTFALLPHVAGLHTDTRILEIMDDIITIEGPRRKKLLADNKCDDIWALRKKGIKVPILYLVIDEYITVRSNLGQLDKELDSKLQVIISQLPSLGVRLLFVPHRATGIVNKTNRTMLQFTASVKGDIEDVKDTLGIPKWTRGLTKPGDIALKTSANQNAIYVRGGALTTSDEENAELMKNVAKAFYKMGVDMPDMSAMEVACNRNEEYIRNELKEDGNRVQYNTLDLD